MSLMARAITTSNAHSHKQLLAVPSVDQSTRMDEDYLHALKLIDRSRRQPQVVSSSTERKHRSSDHLSRRRPKEVAQFSSKLSSVGQEAMLQTYEDTLITHLTDIYASQRIGAVLPRGRSPVTHENRLAYIRQAQLMIDSVNSKKYEKDELLCHYVQWQLKLEKKSA